MPYVRKTTPPTVRVQCQNFRIFGKHENALTGAYNAVFTRQVVRDDIHKTRFSLRFRRQNRAYRYLQRGFYVGMSHDYDCVGLAKP